MENILHAQGPSDVVAAPTVATPQNQFIQQIAARKIRSFRGTIDDEGKYLDPVYQSNRSLAASIASDYRDRFLIELIQNAYDAQPFGALDGRIEIALDMRWGDSGTLFIANSGCPFVKENVTGLCDIGLSGKPLGESIGNKGLGFRSVVQITDAPRVYSQCPVAAGEKSFSGFCFRFAEPGDLSELIDDQRHLQLAKEDLPIFHVPIWVDAQSDVVCAFAEAGFSTVIELPLRDEDALRAALGEVACLRAQQAPLLLFLNRISSVIVRTIDSSGQVESEFAFGRSHQLLPAPDMELYRVDLGEAGIFLVARQGVPESTIKEAISSGISRRELNEHWEGWRGEGEVAVAARLDSTVASPRLYTSLPMGEQASAPFSGHLHGTFFPSSSRKSLSASVQLNAVLLKEASGLAAKTILHIVTDPRACSATALTVQERATVVADLLSWRAVDSLHGEEDLAAEFVDQLVERFEVSSFNDAPVVPCRCAASGGTGLTWQAPRAARSWPKEMKTFTAEVAAHFADTTKVWPIWEPLGPRTDPLSRFLDAHSVWYAGAPRAQERKRLVKLVAQDLAKRRRFARKKWFDFYQEVPSFMDGDGSHLSECPILLGDDGELHATLSATSSMEAADQPPRQARRKLLTAVFSPPDLRRAAADEELEINPPRKLAERFAFLHMKLPWHTDLGDARNFLEQHKLVEEFDRDAVLAHLSRTLRDERNKEVLRGGLRWAFRLWRQAKAHGRPITLGSQHRFRVPTLDGAYREPREVVFSAEWPEETLGPLLQKFLDAAPEGIPDIVRLQERRLAAPSHRAFLGKWIDDWILFLGELGVESGLVPELKSTSRMSFSAHALSNFSFVDDYGIPSEFGDFWRKDISAQDRSLLRLPTPTYYVIEGELPWFPGQGAVDRFSESCAALYAELVLEWMAKGREIPWEVLVHHQTHRWADRRNWPTPLKSFLRSARWLPVEESAASPISPSRVRPCDVWIDVDDGESFKTYLRKPVRSLRRRIDHAGDALVRALEEYGDLRIFDRPSTLGDQLEFLAKQYKSTGFERHFEPHLLKFYERTWLLLAKHMDEVHQNAAPRYVLARVRQEHVLVDMFQGEPVYVCDTDRESDLGLLEVAGRPFIFLREAHSRAIGDLFERLYGEQVRRLSQVAHSAVADGRNIGAHLSTPALQICPRLRAMVAVAMEALEGTEAQRLPTDRTAILALLEHVTMIKAESLSFVIDGMDLSVDKESVPTFHFVFEEGRHVIAVQSSGEWSWEHVDLGIPALCEALGHRALIPHLRLLVAELRLGEAPEVAIPRPSEDVERFCRTLRLPNSARNAAHTSLSAGVERHAPWIRAVLHNLAGPAAVEALDSEGKEVFRDTRMIEGLLSRLLADSQVSSGRLLEVCRTAVGAGDFRDGLNLDFEEFNKSLEALGRDPETYPDLHRSRLKSLLGEREIEIIDSIRASYAPQLSKMQPANGYAVKREAFRNLDPDPAWLPVFKEPPEDVLVAHINAWLKHNNAPSLREAESGLEPLAQVRNHNLRFVNDFARQAMPRIRAWCAKHQPNSPNVSLPSDDDTEHLRERLDEVGVFDFRSLEEAALMNWLQILGIWPSGMQPTLELEALGLSEEDLTLERTREREAREAQERDRRSVSFNGRIVDPRDVDLLQISEELSSGLTMEVLGKSLSSICDLAEVEEGGSSTQTTGGNRPRGTRSARAPPEKTEFIGRLGELVVYYWLRSVLPNQDIETAWQSENGAHITGRDGDDGLGYDFEVTYRKQSWQIEVKASLEDPQTFEMGETEVRAARRAARARSGVQYKIAYVSNVTDSKYTRIEMLPNPLTEEGGRVLQLRGEGIRYGFNRIEC